MKLSLPGEPVVYYECSYGKFRLTYHIPVDPLQLLVSQNKISPKVLEDYPDGVDLNCTESNFAEFQERYGYRPPLAAESIQRAFFALLSSTRDWKNFRGSGFIPAKDIERFAGRVDAYLELTLTSFGEIPELPEHPTLEQRRQNLDQRARQEAIVSSFLEQLQIDGIDPNRTLKNQQFSPVEMEAGENEAKFFSELLRTRGKS
jgi:hypothetical protein